MESTAMETTDQTQLSPARYEELLRDLTDAQLTAVRSAVGGFISTREQTLRALRRNSLVHGEPSRLQNLTPLGHQLYAALSVPPGSFAHTVVQALLDAGLTWRLLTGGNRLREGNFDVDAASPDSPSVFVRCTQLNGTSNPDLLDRAKAALTAAGFGVEPAVSTTPALFITAVTPEGTRS